MVEHHAPAKHSKLLPENAYRKLKPGEEYQPIVGPGDLRAEVTAWAVTIGLILTGIFAAACVYIALRAGNGIEASIPIAILAIFFGKLKSRKSTILENVIVQSIGQASGVVAAGAAFLVPAIYINELTPAWWQIFLACFIGGTLGVVLIIPLRKYFVRDMHGDLPFPEATAVNEILCSGESSGPTAGKVLILAFLLGAAFDFMIEFFHLWPGKFSTTSLFGSLGESMASSGFEVTVSGIAALFGLGYIIGIKYASIIASGSVLAVLILAPTIALFGSRGGPFEFAGELVDISRLGPGGIFTTFVKPIGIGAIAVSGIIGILRMSKIVGSSISLGFKGFKQGAQAGAEPRTQTDMHPKNVLLIQFGMVALLAILFFIVALTTEDSSTGATYSFGASLLYALVGAVVGFLLSFLFTPVAAQAIAIVGVNPVSGMTLITVVFTILVLVAFGLKGEGGMFVALVVGTAVCTALSTSGALISDFKIGYWIGATPRQQQRWKFLGLVVAALVVAFVIPVMDSSYHFVVEDPNSPGRMISNQEQLPAPQANMIAAVAKGLLDDPSLQPWLLYGLGGLMAIVLFMSGVPMLAFALGIYLPIGINMAVLLGAVTAWIVSKTGGSERVRKARSEQGTLIASGMMAGAAILGIISATTRVPDIGAPIRHASVGVEIHLVSSDMKKALQQDAAQRRASAVFQEAFQKEAAAWEVSEAFLASVRELLDGNQASPELLAKLQATAAAEAGAREASSRAAQKLAAETSGLSKAFLGALDSAVEAERAGKRASRHFLDALRKLGRALPASESVKPYESFLAGVKNEVKQNKLPAAFKAALEAEVAREQAFEAFLASVESGVQRGKVSGQLLGKVEDMAGEGVVSPAFLEAVKAEGQRSEAYDRLVRLIKDEAEKGTIANILEQLRMEVERKELSPGLLEAARRRAFEDSLVEKAASWSEADTQAALDKGVAEGWVPRKVADAVKAYGLLGAVQTAASNGSFFKTLDSLGLLLAKHQAQDQAQSPQPEGDRKKEIQTTVAGLAKEGPALALTESPSEWYEGRFGNTLAFLMLVVLGFACFVLARWGAAGTLREEDAAEASGPGN